MFCVIHQGKKVIIACNALFNIASCNSKRAVSNLEEDLAQVKSSKIFY